MSDLWQRQIQLQAEADAVVQDLELEGLLASLGEPFRVGSSAMGLMVRRDIDITVVCKKLDADTFSGFAAIGARLMQHAMVSTVRFRNDCGKWNIEPEKYPDGLYLGLTASISEGTVWNLDIWAVDDPARQPDLAHLQSLLPRLNAENRETILQIKHVLATRPKDAASVSSTLVYEAVMDQKIQTVEQFDAWCEARTA